MRALLMLSIGMLIGSVHGVAIGGEKGPRQAMEALIEALANPKTSEDDLVHIGQSIREHGVNAIPVLIEHLDDKRSAGQRPQERLLRECPKLSLYEKRSLPMPRRCAEALLSYTQWSLGAYAEDFLYQILLDNYYPRRVSDTNVLRQPVIVTNWPRWWRARLGKDLAALQAEARKLIDEYWRQGYQLGPVEWK